VSNPKIDIDIIAYLGQLFVTNIWIDIHRRETIAYFAKTVTLRRTCVFPRRDVPVSLKFLATHEFVLYVREIPYAVTLFIQGMRCARLCSLDANNK